MSTIGIHTRRLPVIDRAAIRIGARLIAWGRRHAERHGDRRALDAYRAEYAERVRTAGAIDHAHLLP